MVLKIKLDLIFFNDRKQYQIDSYNTFIKSTNEEIEKIEGVNDLFLSKLFNLKIED